MVLIASAGLAETRVFTNRDGKTIEAELISVNGALANIRRATDGHIFQLAIASLSLEDQGWIADWIGNRSGEWKTLRIHLPGPKDVADVIGLNHALTFERMGGSMVDLFLPVGAWVELKISPHGKAEVYQEHLVRYDGASRWDVTSEGRSLLLARDGAPPQIVGLTIPEASTDNDPIVGEEPSDFVESFDQTRFADTLSLRVPLGFDPRKIKWLGKPVAAITSGASLEGDILRQLRSWNLEALSLSIGKNSLRALEDFGTLQALKIHSIAFREENGIVNPQFEDQEFRLSQVRDLCLVSIPFSSKLNQSLAWSKGLRLLEQTKPQFSSKNPETKTAQMQEWVGLGGFTALESIHVSEDVRLNAGEVASLPRLKSLAIGAGNFSQSDPGLVKLAEHEGLFQLAVHSPEFDEKVLDLWAANGGLKDLFLLKCYRTDFLGQIPKLERLFIHKVEIGTPPAPSDVFAGLSSLKSLSISNPGPDDLEVLASVPSPGKLEAFKLEGGNVENLDALAPFTSLRRIEINSWQTSPDALDFASFPSLEHLQFVNVPNLREIKNLSALPSLRSFRAFSCANLEDLGDPFENTTLTELNLHDCGSLANVLGFSKTTGLTSLSISLCNALSEPLEIDRINPNAHITVSRCEQLDDRRPVLRR